MKSIVISVPDNLFKKLNLVGFVNGSTTSTLTNEWIKHQIEESLNNYLSRVRH